MSKIKDVIKQLDQILDPLSDEDRMEVYGYLSGKMMRHLFEEEPVGDMLIHEGKEQAPFGEPVVKGSKKTGSKKPKIDPDSFLEQAIYNKAEDIRRLTLRVEIEGIELTIWREMVVPSNLNLESLGQILVDAMGWEGYHLHQFIKGYDHYAIPDEEFGVENPFEGLFGYSPVKNHDSRDFSVGDLLARKRSWINYEYDFGDSWMHRVTVIDSRKYGKDEQHKVELIAGANACPPEDCGGVWGYEEMLEALKKPRSNRAKEIKEWLGYTFEPTEFDLEVFQEDVDFYNREE